MASPGNSVSLHIYNISLDKLMSTDIEGWRPIKENTISSYQNWLYSDNLRVKISIYSSKDFNYLTTVNVLTDGQIEEGSKEKVSKVLNELKDALSLLNIFSEVIDSKFNK